MQGGTYRGGFRGMLVGVAALLGGPGLDVGGVGPFRGCPGLRGQRQRWCREVDTGDGGGMGAGEMGDDAGAEVAAVCDVARVT